MWMLESAKIEAKKFLSYRVDFWLLFVVHSATEISLAYFLWKSLFDLTPGGTYGGLTFPQMLSYYIFVPLVDRIVRANDDFSTSKEIYEGGLNKYLVYPISFISYKLIQRSTYALLAIFQMLLALLIVVPLFQVSISLNGLLLGILASLASFLLYTFIGLCFELIAFWADAVWSLGVMLRFITMFFGGAMIPLTLFPNWGQDLLKLTPFPYLYSVPINTILGRVDHLETLTGVAMTLLWCIPFATSALLIYRRGLKTYTGIGI